MPHEHHDTAQRGNRLMANLELGLGSSDSRSVDGFLYGVSCSNRCLLNLALKADVDVVKNVFSLFFVAG